MGRTRAKQDSARRLAIQAARIADDRNCSDIVVLNLRGISVGEMGSNSSDEDYAGVPMIFLVREVLRRSKTLDEAVAIFQ